MKRTYSTVRVTVRATINKRNIVSFFEAKEIRRLGNFVTVLWPSGVVEKVKVGDVELVRA